MKKILIFILMIGFTHSLMTAQDKVGTNKLRAKTHSMVGYLIDRTCAKGMVMDDVKKSDAKAAKHTKECCLDDACKAAGYGLVTGGKFYKFDVAGDKKAVEYLNATKKEDNLKVEIAGSMDGAAIKVESIKDTKSAGKKAGKRTS